MADLEKRQEETKYDEEDIELLDGILSPNETESLLKALKCNEREEAIEGE